MNNENEYFWCVYNDFLITFATKSANSYKKRKPTCMYQIDLLCL